MPTLVTRILQEHRQGDPSAAERLYPLIHDELRQLARACMRRERPGHTLQPTALVNDAFMRLIGDDRIAWQCRSQFLGFAARSIRQILVNHAEARRAAKRGGGAARQTLVEDRVEAMNAGDVDLLDLNDALDRLAERDARQARVVELRFFGGMTIEETAEVLNVSAMTVKNDWRFARAWLRAELDDGTNL